MSAEEIAAVSRAYQERIAAILTRDELERYHAYQQRLQRGARTPDPLTPTPEEQAILDRIAADNQASAIQRQLNALLRVDKLPQ